MKNQLKFNGDVCLLFFSLWDHSHPGVKSREKVKITRPGAIP